MIDRPRAGSIDRRGASGCGQADRILPLALGLALIGLAALACSGSRPTDLGIRDGRLMTCPDSPNCVSSDATDDDHRIEPLAFEGEPAEAWRALREAIAQMSRTEVVEDTGVYMHVEFTSLLFRYVDDVELDLRAASGVVAVRSASRLGHSDMGANRDRVEALRGLFDAARSSR